MKESEYVHCADGKTEDQGKELMMLHRTESVLGFFSVHPPRPFNAEYSSMKFKKEGTLESM